MKTYKGLIHELLENEIFVFGSNTQGRHGKGAALIAKQKFGAVYGQPLGLQGSSYAIITKDLTKKYHPSISSDYIVQQIAELYRFAISRTDLKFYIAYSSNTGNLNGYSSQQMAKMFCQDYIPENMIFEEGFYKLMVNSLNT